MTKGRASAPAHAAQLPSRLALGLQPTNTTYVSSRGGADKEGKAAYTRERIDLGMCPLD